MSFYPCFWPVLLLTSLVCVALDGVELLKKWAENMKVVIFSVTGGNEWLPHVAKGVGKSAPPSARVSIFWTPYVLHTSVAPHRCSCR